MKKKPLLRVGIIGCGDIFLSHAQAYPEHPNVIVVGFYDRNKSRAETWMNTMTRYMSLIRETASDSTEEADQWDIHRCDVFSREVKVYDNVQDLIENVDFIDICAPNYAHAPYAIWALKKNKHVMTEKPPARCSLETQWIMEAAAKSTGSFQLNENMLWQVYVRELSKLITQGTIGTLQRIEVALGHGGPSWGWNNHFMNPTLSGGGAMADMGIHAIGIAYGILGQEYHVTKIKTLKMHSGTKPERSMSDSDGANEYLMHKFMVEDDARVQITLQNAPTQSEVTVILEVSWSRTLQTTEVFGTKGSISIETDDQKRKVFILTDLTGTKKTIEMPPQGRDSHQIEIIDFVDRIINKKKPYLNATWAHEMQSIISGAYLSFLKAYLSTEHPSSAFEGIEISNTDLDAFYEKILQSGCPTQILIEEIVYQLMGPFTNTKNDSEKKQ